MNREKSLQRQEDEGLITIVEYDQFWRCLIAQMAVNYASQLRRSWVQVLLKPEFFTSSVSLLTNIAIVTGKSIPFVQFVLLVNRQVFGGIKIELGRGGSGK